MQEFFNYLQQFSFLTKNEIEIIGNHVYAEKVQAKSFVLEAGKICQRIGFITKGVISSYYYDTQGNEIVKCMYAENQFAVDILSYQMVLPVTIIFRQ